MPSALPTPSHAQQARSRILVRQIQELIEHNHGWLPFSDYMNAALYTPDLGYYNNEHSPFSDFADTGDFITAPLLSPLFGACLARQIVEIFERTGTARILEVGAGTGRLAADICAYLSSIQVAVEYSILELSSTLRAEQAATLSAYAHINWLNELPINFDGVIIGNEVLDALPVSLIAIAQGKWFERGVVKHDDGFAYQDRATHKRLPMDSAWCRALLDSGAQYVSETHEQQIGLMNSLASSLRLGAIIMIDYGFPAHEFYHPQRNTGTLMCHIQHIAHDDALYCAGVQDITAHVNFSALAHITGLTTLGYTNQANFLINTGILDLLAQTEPAQQRVHANRVSKLLSEAEMGELFKVMAWGKGFSIDDDDVLMGFERGDKLDSL